MFEKIMLAIAITFSLYWSIQIKPPQKTMAMGIESRVETLPQQQSAATTRL
jgi:hypothetical protein